VQVLRTNRGGYGRPPAEWLRSESLKAFSDKELTYKEIAESTNASFEGVSRICEKYSRFLRIKYSITDSGKSLARVKIKRLGLLHRCLAAEYSLKMEWRRATDGRPNHLPTAIAHFISAARSAGFKGLQGFEQGSLPRDLSRVENCWAEVCSELGL
jgi:hypothetical protein